MKKKLFMLSLAIISCVCVAAGFSACTTDEAGNVTIHYHEMTAVEAVDPTCTEEGNSAYWYCSGCGKYFSDYGATTEISLSDTVVTALGHDYTTTFNWSEDYSAATATRVCSHDATHTETVTAVISSETTEATCSEAGSIVYTATATFSDNLTATDKKTTTIPATGEHTYSTDWSYNTTYHWQECTVCGESVNKAEHSYEITDGKAQCTVCGYVENKALSLDTEKTLTLISGETTEDGYETAASYLYYYASAGGGTYSLTLTFDDNMVTVFVDIVVSVNGVVVSGTDSENTSVYNIDLAEGNNYIEISYTGTSSTIVLSDYVYTATLSSYVAPATLSLGANTVTEYETYTFTATDAGYYTFVVSETSGHASLYESYESWTALLDEYGSGKTSYTAELSADEEMTLYVTNGGDGEFVITVTYSATNPDPNAVTTSVPETLDIGDNAIALSEKDGETGMASTFTATEAGTYTFSISGSDLGYATLVYKYSLSNKALQVVDSDDPQLYTLEEGESITIYFYADDDAEYTFNIAFGDYVTTDDDYFKTGTYTIKTTYDADYKYYGYKAVYIIKTTGTYTFTLDTTATTGSEVIYFSNDGTSHNTAAELSLSGTTTTTYELTAGNSIYIYVYDYSTVVATTYVFTISLAGEEAPCEHSYDEGVWTWATDYSTASVKFTCATCGDTKTVTAEITSKTTDATCTEDGSTDYTATATFDGKEYTATKSVTIPSTGHTYEAVVTAPTCTEKGYTTYTCTVCGYSYTADETEAAGHKYESVVTAPTCTEKGYTTYTCSACGYTYKDNYVEATGHTWNSTATCIERECTVCGATIPASTSHTYGTDGVCTACGGTCSHSYTGAVTAPTCTEEGYTTYTCSICGNTYVSDKVAANGHTWSTAATCIDRYCLVCEATEAASTDHIYGTDGVCTACGEGCTHNYKTEVTAPTCTTGGYTTYTCSICGYTYMADYVEATEHTWSSTATCIERECTVCGATIPASTSHTYGTDGVCTACGGTCSHSYTGVVTAPTCTEEGYTTYTCSICGNTYTADKIEATGHTEAEAVTENEVAATCTTDGSYDSVVYCSVCSEELSRETVTVPATGHTESETVTENEVAATCTTDGSYDSVVYCSVCNEEISRETVTVPATGHNYESSVTKEATCTEDGVLTYTCSLCNDSYTEVIPATGHTEAEAVTENKVAATCTTDGSYDSVVYCTVCGKEISRETVTVPAGHTEAEAVTENEVAATCTTDGSYDSVVYCSVCNEEISRETVTVPAGHSYTAAWTWASGYSSAGLTLICGTCGDKQTFTVTSTSASETDSDGVTNTVYTVSYTYNGEAYTDTKQISIYNMSSLSGSVKTGNELFDGFITTYTTSTSPVTFTRYDRSGASTVPALVEGTQYEGVVLTHCIRINGSTSYQRGIQFTLSEDATVFIYYTINNTSGCLILTGDGGTYTIASATGVNTDIYMYKVQLTKGTYKLYTITSGQYDLYSIVVDYNTSTGTCEHTYVESWAWASDYSSAALILTCSLCGDVQTFTVSSTSATDDEGNTVYTVTYTYEGDGNTYETTKTVSAEDSYFTTGTYTVEPTLNESSGDYRYSYTYTVNETGTYTIALDTTATTGSGTLYFSLDGTLSNLAAELSTSGTTSTVCDLNAGGTITVILYGDADAYTYVFTVTYSELCDHSYTETWDWTKTYTSYTSATVTLTCGNCGMVITATVDPTSDTTDGYINYTASYTYNNVTYTNSKAVEIKTFDGTIYDVADLAASSYDVDEEIFEGITIIGNTVSTWSSTYPSDDLIYTDLYGNTVELTTALSIGYSSKKGISFTLKSEATIVLYYAVGSISSFYIYVDEENTAQVVTITPTATSTVMIAEFTLAAGTYSIHCSNAYITAYLYAIGISDGALYIADEDNTLLTLKNGYTWDSEAGDSGAYVYNPTEYELTSSIGTYTLTVKNSGVYVFTAGTSAVTVDGTTISAGSTATFDLYADDVLSITVTDDTTLSVQYTDVTGNAYGTFDSTLYEDDPDSSYTFTNYSGGITLAAGEAVYYRIDAATQDGDGNTSFNFYIYVSGDVGGVSVYYSKTVDGEANIAAKDSYTLVTLTEDGYYYITLSAKGHGYFKIVANSAATITVELNEGGEGGDDSGDSGDSGDYVAMTLGDTMTLDLLVDDNDYRVVYLSYTAAEAGSYTLTLSGSSSMWSQSSMLTAMLSSITVTVNGETVSSETGVYSLSLVEGENTIVINYKFNSSSALASTSFTALLAAA